MGLLIIAGIAVVGFIVAQSHGQQAAAPAVSPAPSNSAIQGPPVQVLGVGPAGTNPGGATRPPVPKLGPVVTLKPVIQQLPPNVGGWKGRYLNDAY